MELRISAARLEHAVFEHHAWIPDGCFQLSYSSSVWDMGERKAGKPLSHTDEEAPEVVHCADPLKFRLEVASLCPPPEKTSLTVSIMMRPIGAEAVVELVTFALSFRPDMVGRGTTRRGWA
ncbi:hypothetical protein [Streptomyces sp. NBC_01176]|uniref:hypothetical protein n=1 Tax=Streptomyces sp. NBC_01176 TaxID=2903760 RepID=UPI0038635D6A|nr:hypothetical protein OG199_44745 [Streptomyces sp. NBC_01176]